MTDEGRREAAAEELQLAEEELEIAEQLVASGHYRVALARTSFAAFHAARARLYAAGLEPKTHAGVQTLWSRQMVQPGHYEPATAMLLSKLQQYREQADYSGSFIVDEASAKSELATASEFVRRVSADLGQG